MTTRPTELQTAAKHCPGAVQLYRDGAPIDRSVFAVGTAAHELLEAAARGIPSDEVIARLTTEGRHGQDAEGPLPVDAVLAGADIARRWLAQHGIPEGASPEQRFALGDDGEPAQEDGEALIATRIDLVYPDTDLDADGCECSVMVARDYKSAWPTDEGWFDSTQAKVQLLMLWRHFPDAQIVRLEVANLRTLQVFRRDFWRGSEDEQIEAWWGDIRAASIAIRDLPLSFAPGAGCMGCLYGMTCPAAWSVIRDPGGDPVVRWAVASSIADTLRDTAKRATTETPREVPGGTVGFGEHADNKPRPDAPAVLASAWASRFGLPEQVEHAIASFAEMTGLGMTAIKAAAKVIHGKGEVLQRAELVERLTVTVGSSRWGLRRGGE